MRRADVVGQGARPGQQADRADRARGERHLQDGQPAEQRLLRHDADRVGQRGDDAQHDADHVGLGAAGGHADEHDPGESDRDARDQPAREALPEQQPGEDRDQDRPDVDQHRRRPGVEVLLGGVESDVVDAEPADAAHGEPGPLPAVGTHPAPAGQQGPEDGGADQQPAQSERPGREVLPHRADGHEGRRPGEEREGDEGEQDAGGASGLGTGRCGDAHGQTLGDATDTFRRFPDTSSRSSVPLRFLAGPPRSGGQPRRCSA